MLSEEEKPIIGIEFRQVVQYENIITTEYRIKQHKDYWNDWKSFEEISTNKWMTEDRIKMEEE